MGKFFGWRMSGPLILLVVAVGVVALLLMLRRSSTTASPTHPPPRTSEQDAYESNPAARITCPHLRPIEDEAREQRIECLFNTEAPQAIFIQALDPEPEAMAPLALAPCVRHEPPRVVAPWTSTDPIYRCTRCASSIAFHPGGYGNDPPPLVIRRR